MVICPVFKATFSTDATCRARKKAYRQYLKLKRAVKGSLGMGSERNMKEDLKKCHECKAGKKH